MTDWRDFFTEKSKLPIQRNVPLKDYTTIRSGGTAAAFLYITAETQAQEVLALRLKEGFPLYIIGKGSNLPAENARVRSVLVYPAGQRSAYLIESGRNPIWI